MTITELREKKMLLAGGIAKMIDAFEADTGTIVNSIRRYGPIELAVGAYSKSEMGHIVEIGLRI